MKTQWLTQQLTRFNLSEPLAENLAITLLILTVVAAAAIITVIVRMTLLKIVIRWIHSNTYHWDDPLVKNKFFERVCWFIPLALLSISIDSFLQEETTLYLLSRRSIMAGFVVVSVMSLNALLTSIVEIDILIRKTKQSVLQGYTDAFKIIAYVLGVIFIISIFTGQSPWGILSVLGGLTAVTMLVFKDSILGFVASLQLSSSDMIRIGDWIEMPQYGADGDVISISIHTVKVQNWDKTITTIPTYALVSSSFKNWRGMTESSGRRIKRSLYIDIHSVRFCTDQLLHKLSHIEILKDYIENKEAEIAKYNAEHPGSEDSLLNGRRQTNIGIFRAYIIAYLKKNNNIHQEMTFLVRQLAPTDHGLPIEIYVFSRDKSWVNYEAIQADIFDHLLAAAAEFDLRVFQIPSGFDLRSIQLESGSQ